MAIADKFLNALFDEQTRNAKLSIALSALIVAFNYAHVSIVKFSIGGTDLTVKDPDFIIGGAGLVLLYSLLISVRFIVTYYPLMNRVDPTFFPMLQSASTMRMRAVNFLLAGVQFIVPILALIVAFPSVLKVIGLLSAHH